MTVRERPSGPASAGPRGLGDRDIDGMLFIAEMYGRAARPAGRRPRRHRSACPRRRDPLAAARVRGVAGRLGPGQRWIWVTRAGLAACGLPYTAGPPALGRLAHIRAVTAVRLALEATPGYAAGARHTGAANGGCGPDGRPGRVTQHVPDGEVHWPDGTAVPWAGECWAIEAELTPKTTSRTLAIMRELLTRTGDYGCPAAEIRVPGGPPRHARVSTSARPRPGARCAGAGGARPFRRRIEIRPAAAGAGCPRRPGGRAGMLIRVRWACSAARRPDRGAWSGAAAAAVMVAAAPVSVVAATGACAWLRGWPPRRLYRAALWCLPMVAVWLAAGRCARVPGRPPRWQGGAGAVPRRGWPCGGWARPGTSRAAAAHRAGWRSRSACSPAAWPGRTGSAGCTPAQAGSPPARRSLRPAAVAAPGAQRAGQDRRAGLGPADHPERRRGRSAADQVGPSPGAAGRRDRLPAAALAPGRHRHHRHRQDDVAAPALGRRSWRPGCGGTRPDRAPPAAGGARLQGRRGRPPDRRPGPPGAAGAGARSTAIWPDEASLSLWELPPRQLTTTLVDLIEHGTARPPTTPT